MCLTGRIELQPSNIIDDGYGISKALGLQSLNIQVQVLWYSLSSSYSDVQYLLYSISPIILCAAQLYSCPSYICTQALGVSCGHLGMLQVQKQDWERGAVRLLVREEAAGLGRENRSRPLGLFQPFSWGTQEGTLGRGQRMIGLCNQVWVRDHHGFPS